MKARPSRLRAVYNDARMTLKHKPRVAFVYILLRFLVILTIIAQFFNRNFENVFLGLLTLVLFVLPTIFERRLMVDLPDTLEIIMLLFIFAAEILGEIQAFYTTFLGWDTLLHTLNGFLCAAIGFSLVDMLNRNERFSLSLSPVFMAIVAFCFSMTMGMLWEVYEFTVDALFGTNMQKFMQEGGTMLVGQSALADTMKDIIVDAVGALVVSVVGYISLCREKIFVSRLLVRKKKKDAKNA